MKLDLFKTYSLLEIEEIKCLICNSSFDYRMDIYDVFCRGCDNCELYLNFDLRSKDTIWKIDYKDCYLHRGDDELWYLYFNNRSCEYAWNHRFIDKEELEKIEKLNLLA